MTICFAHAAYRMGERFALRDTGIRHLEVRNAADLQSRVGEAEVLVVSGLWRNDLIRSAPHLGFIQSISAGTDQYDKAALGTAGIRLASAQGANERAVAEHAMALILALARQIPQARDNQVARKWRALISEISRREDELGGKTLLIVGMGRIGSRLAALARAFDMRVVATKRDPERGGEAAGRGGGASANAGGAARGGFRRPDLSADAGNRRPVQCGSVRGDEAVCVSGQRCARTRGEPGSAGAGARAGPDRRCRSGLRAEEPLPETSPLWRVENVLITPHTAGETRRYEDNVIDLLMENLERLWRGEGQLRNGIV
jgi:phosphoglycerate dehydrogenase-like enzyme